MLWYVIFLLNISSFYLFLTHLVVKAPQLLFSFSSLSILGLFTLILNDVDVGQEDLSMVFTLASTWTLFFAFGSSACVGPMFYTIRLAHQNALNSGLSYGSQGSELGFLFMVNTIIFMALGFVIGYPVASASGKNSFPAKQTLGTTKFLISSFQCWCFYTCMLFKFLFCFFTVKVLQGLWRNDLAALKGSCPNCAEEVSHCPSTVAWCPWLMILFGYKI